MINQLETLPEHFLSARSEDLFRLLKKPTLIHLKGKKTPPLFICTLLHGNETTGFYALQNILKQYQHKELPRDISIFIGNVEAAAQQQRRLDRQIDFNRIWPGTHEHFLAEAHMMKQVTEIMRKKRPFASIDMHNNTGCNPHYGCINKLDSQYLALAGLFSNTVVYFSTPKGVQSSAFAEFCPSLTLECGQSGELSGIDHATQFLNTVLNLEQIPAVVADHIHLYHTVARVLIPEDYSFGFSDDATINLHREIESYNFRALPAGTVFASIEPDSSAYLQAFDDDDREVGRDYFEYNGGDIVLRKTIMPAMLTTDTTVIRQDCLCYLMEKIEYTE
jgi:succinylglutamate desuccinylase